MADLSIPSLGRSGQRLATDGRSQRRSNDGRRSRAERLEIIFRVAAAGVNECSAWIIPTLERSGLNEDSATEKWKC